MFELFVGVVGVGVPRLGSLRQVFPSAKLFHLSPISRMSCLCLCLPSFGFGFARAKLGCFRFWVLCLNLQVFCSSPKIVWFLSGSVSVVVSIIGFGFSRFNSCVAPCLYTSDQFGICSFLGGFYRGVVNGWFISSTSWEDCSGYLFVLLS